MPAPEPQRPGRPVHYEVLAIRYGRLRAPKSELFYRYSSYREADAEVEMAFYFWVLRAGDETLLVDCGFDPAGMLRSFAYVSSAAPMLRGGGAPRPRVPDPAA